MQKVLGLPICGILPDDVGAMYDANLDRALVRRSSRLGKAMASLTESIQATLAGCGKTKVSEKSATRIMPN
jgi:hypothetical protein